VILDRVRTLYNLGTIRDLSDGQLLERFATDGAEVAELAFSALVERHEALVWRVCLAILRNEHEAEDAFQATFLVLVRRARSLWVRNSLGPWLHQVACRTAAHLRRAGLRRRQHEHRGAALDRARFLDRGDVREPDNDSVVHEAVDRLPEKYRAAIVLCDLEGRTHQEAARALGWPIGTVKTRQLQGRRLIRQRLVRRGMALAVAGAVLESLGKPAAAAIPGRVPLGAVRAAMRQSARLGIGSGASASVVALAREVIQAMFWNRVRVLSAAFLAVSLAAGGAAGFVGASQEPGPGDKKGASPPTVAPAGQDSAPRRATKSEERPKPPDPQARLRAQRLATRKARALYEMARLAREVAEISQEEYATVVFAQDLAAVEGEIKLAESDLKRAEDRLEWARRMFDKGFVSQAQKAAEEHVLQTSKFVVEAAQAKRHVLVEYTKSKTLKELQSEVEKARAAELAKQAAWEAEKAKQDGLERQARAAGF
jgi:RNA polymerase sigma factor (sigma-70 family)